MAMNMAMRSDIRRRPMRGRAAARVASLEPVDDTREVDSDYLETLLHDYGEEDAAPVRPPAARGEEAEYAVHAVHADMVDPEEHADDHADEHADDDRRRKDRSDEEHGYHGGDIPDMWMMRGGKAPLLTSAQEIILAKRVERGDQKAREELLDANVRLVASVARRYLGRGLTLEDLMQEGMIGLIRAIEKYNYRKGYRFSTYATHWIRQAVSRALANQGRSIRLPAHVVDAIGRIARVREELFQKLGRLPTRPEVAEAAGITEKKLIQLLKNAAHPVSLESPVGEEGESRLGDFIPATDDSSPTNRVFKHLVIEELERALNTLTPREKEVVILRFGLDEEDPHTLEETGRRLHITRERARQIEAKALEKLRHAHVASRLREAVA
jgi:RNA polymerase primary sigma factor